MYIICFWIMFLRCKVLLVACSNREMKERRNCEGVWSWREWSEGVGSLRVSFVEVEKIATKVVGEETRI